MSLIRDGISASPGIVVGPAYVLHWEPPRAPHVTVPTEDVEREVERFMEAREFSKSRIRAIQEQAAERLGKVEAQIFEPQILMLDDPDLINGTIAYIRENHLSAARGFELRMLEFESEWSRSGHAMLMDRLNDLLDIQVRVVRKLLGWPDPDFSPRADGSKVVLVARDLTPTITVQLDRNSIIGIATDSGTRTTHTAILARSLNMPSVVSLGDLSTLVNDGDILILDGRAGRVIVNPTEKEKQIYRERDIKIREWEQELVLLAHLESVTPDHVPVLTRANIDLPGEAETARAHGAQGIGLYRTEFLVVGRNTSPEEEEQYRA